MKTQEMLYSNEIGTGEDLVVFLPGLGGTTRFWETRVTPLARERRLLLIDLLGFGRSSKPRTRYSVERHVEALHIVLRERGSFILVGHSLGALLALAYTARYPAHVRGLALLSIPYFGDQEHATEHFRRAPLPARWVFINSALAAVTCVLTRRVFGRLLPRLLTDFPREVAGRLCAGRASWALDVLQGVDHHPLLRDPASCLRAIRAVADHTRRQGQTPHPVDTSGMPSK